MKSIFQLFRRPRGKLRALNSIEVVDSSASQGECEYVLADATAKNIKTLLKAGFTEKQISDAYQSGEGVIDLATLAFSYAGASWYSSSEGFY